MSWNKKTDIFALMVGHGTSLDGSFDCGCTYGNYTEAALMYNIVRIAVKWLRKSGVRVLTDSDTKNNRNMKSQISLSNKTGCKYYVSVHCDWSGSTSGVNPLAKTSAGFKMADKIGRYISKYMPMKYKGVTKRTDLYELNASTAKATVVLETGSIKADLLKLRDYKRYGKILAKAICKFIGVKFYVSNRAKLLRKTAYVVAYMNKNHFKYTASWKDCGMTWKQAKKKKRSNCSCMISYAMQLCGFLKEGQIFWINGERVTCKGSGTRKQLLSVAKITHSNKSPKKSDLKKGDVVGYKNNAHTQEFAEWRNDNLPRWYSWGPSDVGKKQPRRKASYDKKKINTIIRLK